MFVGSAQGREDNLPIACSKLPPKALLSRLKTGHLAKHDPGLMLAAAVLFTQIVLTDEDKTLRSRRGSFQLCLIYTQPGELSAKISGRINIKC